MIAAGVLVAVRAVDINVELFRRQLQLGIIAWLKIVRLPGDCKRSADDAAIIDSIVGGVSGL